MTATVLITGANRGIGLSLATLYKSGGSNVIAVCRNSSSELDALNCRVIQNVDVSDDDSIAKLKHELLGVSIDILINNAGILRSESIGNIDYQSIQMQFQINALGPLKVTEALLGNLSSTAKIAMITSRMGSIDDNTSGGRYGYRMSKAALNIASVSLSKDLASRGISVAIIHPGLVGTDMIGGYGDITPDQAAQRIIGLVEQLNLSNSGSFWHSNGDKLPW